ncbi:unnamed protein product [Miscanthus lutarioriparius]|uniref:Zinc finger GRF-type domain-containing protein n=1 Tax=Miscanthus lutarioriparius TaxID=422564 RepID=A0A811QPD4_9POAL|nr:unnamed protein product [Miscanthus lutarioriparius]
MASSSQSTPFGASHSAYRDELRIPELEPYRDEAGFLPLVPCSKCGTLLIGRVSHKEGSKGKRFYKCPLLEHTDYVCRTYYFEEHYVPLLVSKGVLPRHFSQLRGRDGMGLEVRKDGKDMLKACQGVDACQELMECSHSSQRFRGTA